MRSKKILEEEMATLVAKRVELERLLNAERQKWLCVFDNIGEPVYVATMDTFELLYANQAMREAFNIQAGVKCHELLQGLGSPCDFCTNDKLQKPGDEVVWEFKNLKNGRWYKCVDKAIRWPDGRIVRLELAVDITDLKTTQEEKDEWIGVLKDALRLATDAI